MVETNTKADGLARQFVKLGLAAWQHQDDFIDAYYGPQDWLSQAKANGKRPIRELWREAEELLAAIKSDHSMDPQRSEYLAGEALALETGLHLLAGDDLPYSVQVAGLYGISPGWVDESIFEQLHQEVNTLLPGISSQGRPAILERLEGRRNQARIDLAGKTGWLNEIKAELRRWTGQNLLLPQSECCEIQLVTEKPWSGFNQYLGKLKSRVEINVDRPLTATRLVSLIAHEGYPGHHTEDVNKDYQLVQAKGRIEHTLVLTQAPSAIISEGIATHAVVLNDGLADWCQSELFPKLGLSNLDAGQELAIDRALFQLAGVSCNAAILLHEKGADEEQVKAYIRHYSLGDEQQASGTLNFIRHTGQLCIHLLDWLANVK